MLGFLSFILILIAAACFWLGYAFLNDKAEDLLMWSFTGKLKVNDKELYKKQQGMFSILLGFIFLLVPLSIYVFIQFSLDKQLLYIWLPILLSAIVVNAIQTRKFFK